jgi:hypothetical protein
MDITKYADNLVLELHMPGTRRYIKVITTGETDSFKFERSVQGLTVYDETEYITYQQCKHLLVDSVVNGFELTKNLLFPQGFMGVARELAALYREQQATSGTPGV